MKKINFFELIEGSVKMLPKMNKKIWIIGIIISILSGGLIVNESYDTYYEDDYYQLETEGLEEYTELEGVEDTYYTEDIENLLGMSLLLIIPLILLIVLFIALLIMILGTLISIATYYLNYYIYKVVFNEEVEKTSLGNLVKINISIMFRVIGGLLLFIIPGIIAGIKYAPVNYILCKKPNMNPKEVLKETREFSNGFKWKIFKYGLVINLVFIIITLICSPDLMVYGYILLDIVGMIVNLLFMTFSVVFSGIFGMKLYNEINNIKNNNTEVA